jgi:DNA-binding NtrC family response regulator
MKRALIVDDDRFMVRTLSDVLRLKGWTVETAYTGAEAVNATLQGGFDVVLMDIRMPGMDGVAAFKAMKAVKPDVRVILMTAYAALDLIGEAEREGVLRVLPKPVDVAALLGLIAEHVRTRRPVLLIDDDMSFLKTLSEVLIGRGFPTEVASTLDEAGRLIETRQPAAVLLHMHLGPVSARDAVAAVHAFSPAVSLILYSGDPHGVAEIEGEVPRRWIHSYLQKPFAIDRVMEVLGGIVAVDDR